jgi:chemotaxis protein methyltransferase CheR
MTAVAVADGLGAVLVEASRRTGISFAGTRGAWLAEGLRAAFARGETDGRRWDEVFADDGVFVRLCDKVTVQESFFLRERSRFELLKQAILPAIGELDRPLRVWSAGCAAGEEAYSLGIVLRDAGYARRCRVVGTDLSASAIATAKTGVYSRWSLRGLSDSEVSRYFTHEGSQFRLRDDLRADVAFARHNLLDPAPTADGRFDVIFCRNVLIYLTPDALHQVVHELAAALVPGGWLVTSASDPLLDDVAALEPVLTGHGLAYRRRAADRPAAAQPRPAQAATQRSDRGRPRARLARVQPAPADSPAAATTELQLERAERALLRAQPHETEAIARGLLESSPSGPAHALLIQALAAGGDLTRARAAAELACRAFPLDGQLRYLHAVVLLELGLPEEAVRAAREAAYLDPELAEAHLVLARGHELLGHDDAAQRSRRAGLRLIEAGS